MAVCLTTGSLKSASLVHYSRTLRITEWGLGPCWSIRLLWKYWHFEIMWFCNVQKSSNLFEPFKNVSGPLCWIRQEQHPSVKKDFHCFELNICSCPNVLGKSISSIWHLQAEWIQIWKVEFEKHEQTALTAEVRCSCHSALNTWNVWNNQSIITMWLDSSLALEINTESSKFLCQQTDMFTPDRQSCLHRLGHVYEWNHCC